jgi:hypothetical protein
MNMKRKLCVLSLVSLLLIPAGLVQASNQATQTVTLAVSAINEISVSAATLSMTVSAATAGSQPTAVTNTATSYAITTNCAENGKKITAILNTAVPPNTTLKITLAAPTGGSSEGQKTLTTSAVNVVTGVDAVAESGMQISYEFSATVAAGVVSATDVVVTLTIADTV